tara:strand:+ start:919 stop:1140 length:222 start_codon:yes stop_codon:yes gene_type:complete
MNQHTEKELTMIREHAESMWNMRFMGLKWQEIHQKRWDENTECADDTCDCESIYYKNKGIPFFDGVKYADKEK